MWPLHHNLFVILFGPSLVIAGNICDGPQYAALTLTNDDRLLLIDQHNTLRKTIAEGKQANNGEMLPSAKNMYKLNYDCDMELKLQAEVEKCSGQATLSEEYGQNYLVAPAATLAAGKEDRLKAAIAVWSGPLTYYGIKNISNYNDDRLYTFANMAHGKTLRFACHYKDNCNNNVHISCIYNLIGGYQHAVLYEKGKLCTKNKDCTTYPRSTCDTADTKLCSFTGKPPRPGGGKNTICPSNKAMADPGRLAILEAHNSRRSALAKGQIRNGKNPTNKNLPTASFMPKMIYDCATEAEAIDYASTCALTPSARPGDRPGYGENVFIYPYPNADPSVAFEEAAKSWWDQIFLDGINWGLKYSESLRDKPINQKNFIQMAWAKSIKLGCAIQTCGGPSFVVCRYSPAGNILNEQIYISGKICGGCSAACDRAEGLCTLF